MIRSADQTDIQVPQLEARLQTGAARWGLAVRVRGSDDRELVFEVGMAG